MKHIVCFSGGHSSAIVAIEVVRKFGAENVILVNHDINPRYENADIKRFKKEVADYLQMPITYVNYEGIIDPEKLPSQFKVCVDAGALTDPNKTGALCTAFLKTIPFTEYLSLNFYPTPTLFQSKKDCIIYYGFDAKEKSRIQRRTGILESMGYKTDYPMLWSKRTIFLTTEISIAPPLTYKFYKHANCKGCLKASLLHWYVTFCNDFEIYAEASEMEDQLDFTIHTVIRNKQMTPISLIELSSHFTQMKTDKIPATEHQSMNKFANLLKKYQLQELAQAKPCECIL